MTTTEIKSLIKYLQNNGGPVISGQTKFSVTSPILNEINKINQSIKEDLYVSKLTNSDLITKYSNNNELMFIYDFIKKTPKLKISNSETSHNLSLDVGDFTNLKYLELYKVNVKELKGIQFLRESLEMVLCYRCLEKLGDLLLNPESKDYVNCIWSKLRHAVLSHNDLGSLDVSFIHTPWLQYLDLSYNHLTDIRQLECLRHLTHLNVGYNQLKEVPKFAMFKLKVLLLNNNYIMDLSGISSLETLQKCDLSDNAIADHATLLPLADLPLLRSLNLLRNPINYHHIHRSLTCGYLHENITNKFFSLDGQPLTSAEREYIRFCSRRNSHIFRDNKGADSEDDKVGTEKSRVIKKKQTKKIRDAVIADQPNTSTDLSDDESILNSTLVKEEDLDEGEHLELQKQIEAVRSEHGPEHWLHSKAGTQVAVMIGIKNSVDTPVGSPLDFRQRLNSFPGYSSTPHTGIDYWPLEETLLGHVDVSEKETEENLDDTANSLPIAEQSNEENNLTYVNSSSSDDEESDDQEDEQIHSAEDDLWLVERVEGDSKDSFFLILNDDELLEQETIKRKVITRWSVDCIERYVKISSEPFTLHLFFNVLRRDNRQRKYIMEYADAQVLMNKIDKELEARNFDDKILLRCIKCEALFCHEKPRRKSIHGADTKYVCPTCQSTAVLEEDPSILENKNKSDNSSMLPTNGENESRASEVTLSPSLSSIGSAASLDQNSDRMNNDESHVSYPESDIEVISNPSESSIEVLDREPNRSNENKTVLQKLTEKLSTSDISMSDVTAALNQVLTESSSSGSMTDSSCTTVESNYHATRGPHRISQSTVDEVIEESSAENSPQERRSEEKSLPEADASSKDKNVISETNYYKPDSIIANCVTVLEGVLHSVSQKVSSSTPPRKADLTGSSSLLEYSFTNFSCVDHRIKFFLWDEIIPSDEEISAFVKVNAICKSNQSGLQFPGFLVFTNKKMYLVRMTKEEDDDNFGAWLQKYDNVSTEKIKLIQAILWKQGFCVHIEDLAPNGNGLKYIILLYDKKRTDNFLTFVKDLGSVHVEKADEFQEKRDSFSLIQTDEKIRNLTLTDSITVCGDNGGNQTYNFVALVITNSKFIMLKADVDWLLPNSTVKPTIIREEILSNLVNVELEKERIALQFMDETENSEKLWYVKTVSSDAVEQILIAIREPWKELFDVNLPVSQSTN